MEVYLPCNGRDADTVAVSRDPRDNAVHQVFDPFAALYVSETEGVERGYRSCAHRKNVPYDAPHACSSAMVRFYCRGMVMAFYFHDNGKVVSNVDYSGIFSRSLEDPFA